jgi:non-ribosomal peptide synthetase component E (peptide arylation enzyme)
MRWKIILVHGGIVLVLSIVTFFLLRTSLATVVANPKAQRAEVVRAIHAADARLTLDSLMAERWLDREAATEEVRGVFLAGTADARSDSATARANQLRDKAVASPEFSRIAPSLVLFVDSEGVGVGRNGS